MAAVEWLIRQIDNKDMGEIPMWVYDFCYDAIEMEKQQIIDAWDRGLYIGQIFPQGNIENIYEQDSEQYFKETYKKDKDMATIYKVEVTSHWISYSKEELEKILTEAVKKIEFEKGNTIQIRVEDKK